MVVTDHGEDRLRHRLGFPKRAVPRMAAKALREGRHREDFRGELRKYLDNVFISHGGAADNMWLLGETLYLFDGEVLITAWTLPKGLRPLVRT